MKRTGRWLAVGVALAAVLAITQFLHATTPLKVLDSVFLFEATDSIIEDGRPESLTIASWPDGLRSYREPVDDLCMRALPDPVRAPYNVLDNHAYLALYPIALIAALIGAEWTFAVLNAAAHVALLLLSFLFLRQKGVGTFPALGFVAVLAAYPALVHSLEGDYYLDRLYMPLALGALYSLHGLSQHAAGPGDRRRLALLSLLVVAAALTTERAAIMMAATLVFFATLYPHIRHSPQRLAVMGVLVVAIGAYLAIYFAEYYVGIEGGGNLLGATLSFLSNPMERLRAPGLLAFLSVNAVLACISAFGGWRNLLLALGAVVPNVVIGVGGAELNGWVTHYHTMYIPFLVFAASIGWARLTVAGRPGMALVAAGVASAWMLAAVVNPASMAREPAFAMLKQGFYGKFYRFQASHETSYERVAIGLMDDLERLVPTGARVSSIPHASGALYSNRRVALYPMGLDDAEYLVVGGTAAAGDATTVSGATSYLGAAEQTALNDCLSKRFARDFALHGQVPGLGVLVFRRR